MTVSNRTMPPRCATGKQCVVLSFPGIGLDVDNPSDLYKLACRRGRRTRSQATRPKNEGFASYPTAVELNKRDRKARKNCASFPSPFSDEK